MAHVEQDHQWNAAGTPEELAPKVIAALKGTGVAVFPGDPVRFKGGSGCMTRLIGGWFVGPGTLPKAGTVRLSVLEPGTTLIELRIEDTLGFALVDPMFRKRFEESFAPIVGAVRNATGGPT